MDQIEIKGKVNTAICYARVVEEEAIEQIRRMCDYPMTEDGCRRLRFQATAPGVLCLLIPGCRQVSSDQNVPVSPPRHSCRTG